MFEPTDLVVHIEELSVLAYVGLYAAERNSPQKLLIDIECTLSTNIVANDDLRMSVDYVPIADAVRKLCLTNRRKLIETLAEEIATACFAHDFVRNARIRIRKPFKMPNCAAVGITRTFVRKETV